MTDKEGASGIETTVKPADQIGLHLLVEINHDVSTKDTIERLRETERLHKVKPFEMD